MFIAALFTVAKSWEHQKHPLIQDWIKKMWYIYTREYYAAVSEDEILPFVTT